MIAVISIFKIVWGNLNLLTRGGIYILVLLVTLRNKYHDFFLSNYGRYPMYLTIIHSFNV